MPRVHLRRFARPGPGKHEPEWFIDAADVSTPIKVFRANVRNVGAERNFYTFEGLDGKETRALESFFGQLEGSVVPVWRALLDHPKYALTDLWPLPTRMRGALAGVQVLVTVHYGSDELLPLVVFQIDDPGMEHRVSSWAIMSSMPPRSSPNSGFYFPTGMRTPSARRRTPSTSPSRIPAGAGGNSVRQHLEALLVYVRSTNPQSLVRRRAATAGGTRFGWRVPRPVSFDPIVDDTVKDRVDQAFRAKYGADPYFSEELLSRSRARLVRVKPR